MADVQAQYGGLAVNPLTPTPSPIMASYQPTPQQVYTPQNVQQTVTSPLSAPNYADPYALRDYFYNSPDVVSARQNVQKLTDQLNSFDTSQNQQQNYLENQTVAMPVITGEQANQARLGATQREALARDLLAKQSYLDSATSEADSKYQIAQQQRAQIQDLITQTGGKAEISYSDSFEKATKKASEYLKKKAKKDTLKQMYLETFGTAPKKGMSSKEIAKKLGKNAEAKKAIQDRMDQIDLQLKENSLKKSSGGGSGGSSSSLNALLNNAANMPEYGREWAVQAAPSFGVDPNKVKAVTAQNGWEGAYRSQSKPTAADTASQINRNISQISDWNEQTPEDQAMYIRSLGGDPKDYGL